SSLMSFRASLPSIFGMFRSKRMRQGLGAFVGSENLPLCWRYSKSSSPLDTTTRGLAIRFSSMAFFANIRSSASSSAIKMGAALRFSVISLSLFDLRIRKDDLERGALPRFGGRADRPAMALDHFPADRQTDAGPL